MRGLAFRRLSGVWTSVVKTATGFFGAVALSACSATIPSSTDMVAGGETMQPAGYGQLCQRHPDLCDLNGAAAAEAPSLEMTADRFGLLARVNSQVNRRITYRNDREVYGVAEHWTPADRVGDCEDYALTKLTELLAEGIPRNVMRLASARQRSGVPHAVLTIRTDRGVYVLDNNYDYVVPWEQLGYRNWRWEQAGSFRWQTLTGDQLAAADRRGRSQ